MSEIVSVRLLNFFLQRHRIQPHQTAFRIWANLEIPHSRSTEEFVFQLFVERLSETATNVAIRAWARLNVVTAQGILDYCCPRRRSTHSLRGTLVQICALPERARETTRRLQNLKLPAGKRCPLRLHHSADRPMRQQLEPASPAQLSEM